MKLKDEILLFAASILVLLLTAAAYYKELNTEWKSYQAEFEQIAVKKLGAEKAAALEKGFHQIWVPSLKIVDRCKTCHMAIDIPGFETEKQPFTTHSNLNTLIKTHPFKNYGCTSCHSGQGYATETKDAHGEAKHWEEPMLSTKLAKDYGLKKSASLMEMNCNTCHRRDESTPGLEYINRGKKLLKTSGCIACHVIEGKGASVGPDITYEGDKHAEGFTFTNVQGKKSVLNWHIQHFKDPNLITPGSKMTNFNYNDDDAMALSLLVMSWRKKNIPYEYIYDPNRVTTNEPMKPTAEMGQMVFASKGCVACHTMGQGKRVGPDLKDVTKRRKTEWLSKFISKPSEMLSSDSTAKSLLKEFNNVPMPDPVLSDDELKSLMELFKAYDAGKIQM